MSNGKHLILDLYGCDPVLLDDYQQLEEWLQTALQMANATILRIIGEKFKPQGVTLLALLSESHASMHTWPEMHYCAIDLYTCGTTTDGDKAAAFLKYKLKSEIAEEKEIIRSTSPYGSEQPITNPEELSIVDPTIAEFH